MDMVVADIFNQKSKNSHPVKPKIYMAGKICKSDWRHGLVTNLRNHNWHDGPIETDKFTYMGPFFISCDHGCAHHPNSHGAANQECTEPLLISEDVIRRNNRALRDSDLIFCYINSESCFGTLIELGMAVERNIPIILVFAPWINHDDFWYLSEQCMAVEKNMSEDSLSRILKLHLCKMTKARL